MGKHASASVEIETHDLPVSALQREQQRLAYVLAVDNMATVLRVMDHQIGALTDDAREHAHRINALERDAAVGRAFRSASFMARLRWLVDW